MKKIGLVAQRDFVASVTNRGFVIGLLIMPVLILLLAVLGPRIVNARSPQVKGSVAIVDGTGNVADELKASLDPQAITARRTQNARRTLAQAAPGVDPKVASDEAIQRAVGTVPALQIMPRGTDVANVSKEKDWLLGDSAADRRLALVVIHADAVATPAAGADYGGYDLYVTSTMDEATESVIHEGVRQALTAARLKAGSLDRAALENMMNVTRPPVTIVGAKGEQQSQRTFSRLLPVALSVLLFMGVMLGGQTLMTSTIEEKSNRVVEVLLAAASPLELMAGKLIGQMAISLLVLAIYIGMAFFALSSFAMLGLMDPTLIVYLLAFFVVTYLFFGSLMLAIGAAVNQINEAQSLMGPVMMLLVLPYALGPMVARAPNSTIAVVASFIPPINGFVMMSRLATSTPPPVWQIGLTLVIGLSAAVAAVWFAAKVFKIGLLMHGKPPNFATLIRWARMA